MRFIGKTLVGQPLPNDLDWTKTQIVLVSGDAPNACGHILLYVGGGFGHYFQFTGPSLYDYPRFLNGESEYRRFVTGAHKREISRKSLTIPNPKAAESRLLNLMQNHWMTGIVVHNCATFAIEVVKAGGNFWTFPEECPIVGIDFVNFLEKTFGRHDLSAGTGAAK